MNRSYLCVLIAGLLPYVGTIVAKWGFRFDNRQPREWLAKQSGWRARANAAQANGFEAFPFFAAAVIVASLKQVPQGRLDLYSMVFVGARVLYVICYLIDWASLRSFCWMVGLASVVGLFLAALGH